MIDGVGGGSDFVEQTRVAALGRPQYVKRARLDERQCTQTFGLAQCEPERDAAIVGMTARPYCHGGIFRAWRHSSA